MNTVGKGSAAENRVASYLEERGWVVGLRRHRKGGGDWLAVKRTGVIHKIRVVEVKSDKDSPWANFRPADRKELRAIGRDLNAEALLAWSPNPKTIKLIPSRDWP